MAMEEVQCAKCRNTFQSTYNDFERTPCPHCGSTNRIFNEHIVETLNPMEGTILKQGPKKRMSPESTQKRWLYEEQDGVFQSRDGSGLVCKTDIYDRVNDWRFEEVTDWATGVPLVYQNHRLSDHRNHGSAKFKQKKDPNGSKEDS